MHKWSALSLFQVKEFVQFFLLAYSIVNMISSNSTLKNVQTPILVDKGSKNVHKLSKNVATTS